MYIDEETFYSDIYSIALHSHHSNADFIKHLEQHIIVNTYLAEPKA